ncbi:hypothetical protein D3C83_112850 [compost metagenome]
MATMTWLYSPVSTLPSLPLIFAVTPVSVTLSSSSAALVRIVMPCLVSDFSRNAETSASSTGTIRSSISTTVTSAPMSL